MIFYIAVRNPNTGLFEICSHMQFGSLEPTKYENEETALVRFENEVNIHGVNNVLMYESIPVSVSINAKIVRK